LALVARLVKLVTVNKSTQVRDNFYDINISKTGV
jgi:hypothetical protein